MKAKKVAYYGVFISLALVLSYLESLVPLSFAIPGIKMGLPNSVVIFTMYRLGFKDACVISLIRALLVSILFGNAFSLAYSLAGAVLSLIVMFLLCKTGKFGKVGVSVAGAVAHNVGQILVAIFVMETWQIVYYLPVLCISGTIAGICIGLISALILNQINRAVP